MAKRSKAKAKRAKTTKKTTKAKKTRKTKRAKKVRKPIRRRESGGDPCAAQEKGLELAQEKVDNLTNELEDPGIPPEERRRVEKALQAATTRLRNAEAALERCRREHPGNPG